MNELKRCPFCGGKLEVFEDACGEFIPYCYTSRCALNQSFETEAECKDALNRRADGWIKITPDTLPNSDADVLMWGEEFDEPREGYYRNSNWYQQYTGLKYELGEITHWMYKPKPPIEG